MKGRCACNLNLHRRADTPLHRWSGWWDSNPRPPRPERGALAKLSHSPNRSGARRLYPVPAQINRRFGETRFVHCKLCRELLMKFIKPAICPGSRCSIQRGHLPRLLRIRRKYFGASLLRNFACHHTLLPECGRTPLRCS